MEGFWPVGSPGAGPARLFDNGGVTVSKSAVCQAILRLVPADAPAKTVAAQRPGTLFRAAGFQDRVAVRHAGGAGVATARANQSMAS